MRRLRFYWTYVEVAEVTDQGHIEGAVNIPLRELGDNLDLLPTADTPIVVYCGSAGGLASA